MYASLDQCSGSNVHYRSFGWPIVKPVMNIDSPLRELGAVNITRLRDAILSQEDSAWQEAAYRQPTRSLSNIPSGPKNNEPG